MGSCNNKNQLAHHIDLESQRTKAGRVRSQSLASRVQRPPAILQPLNLPRQEIGAVQFHGRKYCDDQYINSLLNMNEEERTEAYKNNPLVHSPLKEYIKYQLMLIEEKKREQEQIETACNSKKEPSCMGDSSVRYRKQNNPEQIAQLIKLRAVQNEQNMGPRVPVFEQSTVLVKSEVAPCYDQSKISIKLG